MWRAIRDEKGFSLVELTIAMVIGLLVLGVGYLIFDGAMRSFRIVEEDAQVAADGAHALHIMSRYLRETEYIDYAGDDDLKVRCDHDDDGAFEEVRYYRSGDQVWEDVRELSSTSLKSHRVLASNVRNTGPLFQYWLSIGQPALPDPGGANGERRTKTELLTITLILDVDPTQVPEPFEAKTEIALRNII